MDLVYLGTPEMAVPPLVALHAAGHRIELVVSGPDKRRGRRGSPTPSPVKAAALELGLAVTDDMEALTGTNAELGVVAAYGRLVRPHLLARLPMINLHFSLLPRWRGAAPVERAMLAGDAVTGVCLMALDEGLDTGCVYGRVEVPIGVSTTAADLRGELVRAGTDLLLESLRTGLGRCVPQSDVGVTYADKLTADDLRLDWNGQVAYLDRQIRVGGAWTTWGGERFKIHRAAPLRGNRTVGEDLAETPSIPVGAEPGTVWGTRRAVMVHAADGDLRLEQVQPAGRPSMGAGDWANGASPFGDRLGAHGVGDA